MSYNVLVTGGRDFNNRGRVWKDLSRVMAKHPDMAIWSGQARGADQLAYDFACFFGLDFRGFAARWDRDGKSAGAIRNNRMIAEKPDLVVAFKGGKGTAHCVNAALKAGIPVWNRASVDEPDTGH